MQVSAIIAAGGRGVRLGRAEPKQLLTVGGRPILERSVSAFLTHPEIGEVVVALPRELVDAPPPYLQVPGARLRLVAGGARRQDSVANAFARIDEAAEIVVVHDAARPFASAALISRTIAAAAEWGAAAAALPARDTVKRVTSVEVPFVRETLPREAIYLAQTPQAFRRAVLADALAVAAEATDEAMLAEQAGHRVRIVDGERSNIKITTPEDLAAAEALARAAQEPAAAACTGRAGIGYDLHRLVEGRPLVLGGVAIPFEKGLLGHSDADVVCHAIADALLGAAGAGDIGRHFPDSDPKWKGASSLALLEQVAQIVGSRGLAVGSVDATIVAERPTLAPHVAAMRANVARAIGIGVDRVSIKGKTNEGVGELGRGEAIAVHAIAFLAPV